MLDDILNFLKSNLEDDYLTPGAPHVDNVTIDYPKKIKDSTGLIMTIVNLEEEYGLKNQPNFERKNGNLTRVEPPVFLNIYILFVASHTKYETALTRISQVIDFFQTKHFFTKQDAGFPADLEKLSLDLYSLKMEQLNYLWSILGGVYYPSVLYKVRVAKMKKVINEVPGPEIKEIQLASNPL